MLKFLKVVIISAIILYAVPLVLVYIFQRSFLYIPPKIYMTPQAVGLSGVEEISLQNSGGDQVSAWWIAPANDRAPVIMFFHGNGSAVYSNHDIYRDLQAAGYGVLGAGYPGYPGSTGKPTQDGIIDAVEVQYDWLTAQGISPDRIVFYGTSLGTGIASQLTLRRPPILLILEAPFTSGIDMGREAMPVFPVKWLMKDSYESVAALAQIRVPMVWMHGTEDDVVPFRLGRELFDGYQGPKSELIITGGQHTNLWGLGAREFVLDELSKLAP